MKGLQIINSYSKIDQTRDEYSVLKNLGSLKSEEWHLIKHSNLEDLPTMYSMVMKVQVMRENNVKIFHQNTEASKLLPIV